MALDDLTANKTFIAPNDFCRSMCPSISLYKLWCESTENLLVRLPDYNQYRCGFDASLVSGYH